jgi:alpha-beta hydrolase superfamily lysophospholipase
MTNRELQSREIPLSFLCGKDRDRDRDREKVRLYGILHQPARPSPYGLLIVTGRPALRTGRHRLFVLLARTWAEAGIPVMRFDFRGTGDCEGEMGTLDDTSEDLASAVDAFMANAPGLHSVVLWGLCGGAADAILYAPRDPRVIGIAMVNPWSYDARVRGLTALRRYASFCFGKIYRWTRSAALRGRVAVGAKKDAPTGTETRTNQLADPDAAGDPNISAPRATAAVDRAYASYRVPNLSRRLADSLEEFQGRILLILSGRDTGSQAFKHAASISLRWRRLLSAPRVQTRELPESNHSLRRPEWRAQAATWTIEWLHEMRD